MRAARASRSHTPVRHRSIFHSRVSNHQTRRWVALSDALRNGAMGNRVLGPASVRALRGGACRHTTMSDPGSIRGGATQCGITTTQIAFCVLLMYPLLLFITTMHGHGGVARQPEDSPSRDRHGMMARRQGHESRQQHPGDSLQDRYGRRASRKTGETAGDSHPDGHERQHHRHGDVLLGKQLGYEERRNSFKHHDFTHSTQNDMTDSSGLQPGQTKTKCRVRGGVRCDVR